MMQVIEQPTNKSWDKFYSVYMFDEIKYHKLCKQHPQADRAELRKQCYVLDDGKRVHLGDEKHIFRIQELHKIQIELAEYCKKLRSSINYWEKDCSASVVKENYTLFYERYDKGVYNYGKSKPTVSPRKGQLSLFDTNTPQNEFKILNAWEYYAVEINDTWQLPIKERLLLHLEVLRLCRLGESLDKAVKFVLKHTKI